MKTKEECLLNNRVMAFDLGKVGDNVLKAMDEYAQQFQPKSPELYDKIEESLNSCTLLNIKDEDGNDLPLVDFLSLGETIKGGQEEIENLVDQIAHDLEFK